MVLCFSTANAAGHPALSLRIVCFAVMKCLDSAETMHNVSIESDSATSAQEL